MLILLYNSHEFKDVELKKRQKAAWQARQCAMRHWRFWFAVIMIVVATVIGSVVQQRLQGSKDTALGAGVGFLFGMIWYSRTLYVIGMPYYRDLLSKSEEQ